MKNNSLFYWLLTNLKSPMQVTIIREDYSSVTGTPRNIFKVFRHYRKYLYTKIYRKEAHNGEFVLYVR